MNADKLTGLLGMCRRSGRLTSGFDAVCALDSTPHAVVLLASDAAPRTEKELRFRLRTAPLYRLPLSKDTLASAIGSPKPVAVVATADAGFAAALCPLCQPILKEESHYDD